MQGQKPEPNYTLRRIGNGAGLLFVLPIHPTSSWRLTHVVTDKYSSDFHELDKLHRLVTTRLLAETGNYV